MQWFVVHTKPRQEQRALENLQRQGFAAWLPMLSVEKFRRGRLEKVVEPMFSRYLFIRLDTEQTNWSPIRSRSGLVQRSRWSISESPGPRLDGEWR